MPKRKPPSLARTYDVEMIRDFFEHLLWEVRISHFEAVSRGKTNPEMVNQLMRFQKKRQTVGLLFGVVSAWKPAENPEEGRRVRAAIAGSAPPSPKSAMSNSATWRRSGR